MPSFRLLLVGLFFGCACGGPQQVEVALPCPESEAPDDAPHIITPADLAPLMMEPERLITMVDADRGVAVVRILNCEREGVHDSWHACGNALETLTPLLPELQAQIRSGMLLEEEAGIACAVTGPRSVECVIPPHNECEPTFRLLFSGSMLTAIIERDDWQSQAEYIEATDREIGAFLAREPACQAP